MDEKQTKQEIDNLNSIIIQNAQELSYYKNIYTENYFSNKYKYFLHKYWG